jgi:hypothetical protein
MMNRSAFFLFLTITFATLNSNAQTIINFDTTPMSNTWAV